MNGNEYKQKAIATANMNASAFLRVKMDGECHHKDIDLGLVFNAVLGLTGESGEFADAIKKWIFHDKKYDEEHLKKELGDICWYIALACEAFGWDLDEILQMNIDKLAARYHGGGFNTHDANNKAEGDV